MRRAFFPQQSYTLSQRISAGRFLEIFRRNRDNIQSANIVPARLGENDFGSVEVVFRSPVSDRELCLTES